MFTRAFWVATAERAVSTAAQSALLVMGADQINAITANWQDVAGFAAGGFALAVLKCLVAANIGSNRGPSLANEVVEAPGRHAA